ncbi:MAG TPA: amino acid transporter, partial [Nocardioidaceae bacterium]|nr:amino acid transporter [Nocardioidaceae bacterium]
WAFAVITLVFVYTTVDNVIERPDGVKIGACFIAAILAVSFASRLSRSFELRTTDVHLDATAELFLRDCARRTIRLVANEPDDGRDPREYDDKLRQIRDDQDLPDDADVVFVEVTVTDPSDFESRLDVHGRVMHGHHRVLTVESSSVPNALAALLLHMRDVTGVTPHIYFEWTEGNPAANFARFLLFGSGEVAPVTREVLRRNEPRRRRRPHVHVG